MKVNNVYLSTKNKNSSQLKSNNTFFKNYNPEVKIVFKGHSANTLKQFFVKLFKIKPKEDFWTVFRKLENEASSKPKTKPQNIEPEVKTTPKNVEVKQTVEECIEQTPSEGQFDEEAEIRRYFDLNIEQYKRDRDERLAVKNSN